MDIIPVFDVIFKQIKTNFWLIGIPFDHRDLTIRYFVLLIIINTTILQELAFFFSNISPENFLELTQLAPCVCMALLSVLKIISIALHRQRIFDLTRSLKKLYNGKILDDIKKWKVVRKDFTFLKHFIKFFFILNSILITVYNFSTPVFMFYHYYTKNVIIYSFPYAIQCPFSTDTFYAWLFVYLHSIISGFICIIYVATVDGLYYILTTHVCAQFTLLSDEIQYLDEITSNRLSEIVKRHQYILQLSEVLEEIFRTSNFFNVLNGSIIICALGFNLTMGHWTRVPAVALFLLTILSEILMISVFGENLIRESRKVGEAAFCCKWYNMDQTSKKIILFLMLRSNKPQKLTAYKFSVISYESFTKIISTSWSYFTILRTVYNSSDMND